MKLTLPVDDPFWNEHHPGDRWNCKCSLEATDEPVVRPADLEPTHPQRGLENNPGKDGHTFSDKHPYFPSDCNRCFANRGLKNKLKGLFLNQEKNCYSCPLIDNKMKKAADKVNWLFNIRKKRAIKQAQQLANEQRRKFLVLNFKGKPTVVSMKQIKFWISTKQVNKDADYFREMALFTAMPK